MERKWVHFLFAFFGVVLVFLLVRLGRYAFETANVLWLYVGAIGISAVLVGLLWRSRVFSFVQESMSELEKVSWPTSKETALATMVVVLTVAIAAVFLGVFDLSASSLIRLLFR